MSQIGLRTGFKATKGNHSFVTSDVVDSGLSNTAQQLVEFPTPHFPRDQKKQIPCCVSCAIVAAMEALDGLMGGAAKLSPMFHYFFARPAQAGMPWLTFEQGLAAAVQHGVCREELFPSTFESEQLNVQPPDDAIEDGLRHCAQLLDPATLEHGFWELTSSRRLEEWKRTLSARIPILMGFHAVSRYLQLDHADGISGDVLPTEGETTSDVRHAAAVLGFRQQIPNDPDGAFWVVDSRGPTFGTGGGWWLPFALVETELVIEAWALRLITYGLDGI
ncbi:MAG: hypothetical protein IAG10_31955 [Planctomycetaceae bacterium]|nr:hypothetical protein [Planctomycetaceae bacterium]